MPRPDVADNPAEHRFESRTPSGLAFLTYRRDEDDRLVLLHTEVPEDDEGEGYGSALVRAAFDQAREQGRRVVPLCPFVHAWLQRHPDQADLADSASR